MPTPKDAFDNPQDYLDFFTLPNDDDFEDQYFDRKEIGSVDSTIRQVQKTISAFANSNKQGGLLVLGISTRGVVKGVKSKSEKARNSCTNINNFLKNHSVAIKSHNITNEEGLEDQIILIYSMYVPNAICQSVDSKCWIRSGTQSIIMSRELEEQIKRDKGIISFERTLCCEFRMEDLDKEVFQQFSEYHEKTDDEITEFLYNVGALSIHPNNKHYFTNAGLLFFASNPQRVLNYAHIRLAKFEVAIADFQNKGLPTKEITFDGPLSKQILKARAYFKESGFFKIYQKRKLGGGFIEDPEFPMNAIDEGIVNAIAHRDYGIQLPIECLYYKDAFYIENPGIIKQRDIDVPNEFTLKDTILISTPTNSLIIEWLKQMKDDKGASFVQKWGEGTKSMKKAMDEVKLPSPHYNTSIRRTILILKNNYIEREAILNSLNKVYSRSSTEFLNFYKLIFLGNNSIELLPMEIDIESKVLISLLKNKLEAKAWYIDRLKFGRIKAHKKGDTIQTNQSLQKKVLLYSSYLFQIRKYHDAFYLLVDYSVEVKNIRNLYILKQSISPEKFINLNADYLNDDSWGKGKIIDINEDFAKMLNFETQLEEFIETKKIVPKLPNSLLLESLGNESTNLSNLIKKAALTLSKNAVRDRINKTNSIILDLDQNIFPLQNERNIIALKKEPVSISQKSLFKLDRIQEPKVEFGSKRETVDIRDGITKFGSYNSKSKKIQLIPICLNQHKELMVNLIYRLQTGKYKYKGVESTFGTRIVYDSVHTVSSDNNLLTECKRLISQSPEWVGNDNLDRLFLIQIPENGYSKDNFDSPYFQIKKFLFEKGIPCQMVSTSTLHNPDWRDLNLALNIVTKCGITPWVLPNKIPEADFFIGLSYSQQKNYKKGNPRLIGYANVINCYGKWEFFSGETKSFNYSERTKYFSELTGNILKRLDSRLPESPNIHFHYSAKFSREDRECILEAARRIRPNGTYTFTSINSEHIMRLYDNKPETNGSLSRGSYVELNFHQLLLSTTGFNSLGKSLGTPKPLEATVWTYSKRQNPIDLKSIAVQILSLTKLNWASTSSISSTPITLKYASDIAYLTLAFLSSDDNFTLHPVLEKTPWFI